MTTDTHDQLIEINFGDLLDILHIDSDDRISLNIKRHGQWCANIGARDVVLKAALNYIHRDLWFGVNPTSHQGSGRGVSAEVTRIAALVCEIDDDKMSRTAADAVIADLAALIGWPSAIVDSGHGRHFYWPVDRGDAEALSNGAAAALAGRFGHLVKLVAAGRRGLVDTVSDLARVLRVPGTTNCKPQYPEPAPVRGYRDPRGVPLRVADVRAALDAKRIPEIDEIEAAHDVMCPPSDWAYTAALIDTPCKWLAHIVNAWATDEINYERHKWLLNQSTRLHCALRHGCVGSEDQYQALVNMLHAAFLNRLAGPPSSRQPDPPNEFEQCIAEGQRRAACKTEAEVLDEIRAPHHHDESSMTENTMANSMTPEQIAMITVEEFFAETIDGATLLDAVATWFGRFIACEKDDLDIMALWTVHTHLAAECYTTPRLLLDSAMPRKRQNHSL